jgi:5-methylcytosine-specific restriction endonuclease McrBC regulatory subunit McrC
MKTVLFVFYLITKIVEIFRRGIMSTKQQCQEDIPLPLGSLFDHQEKIKLSSH